MYTAERPHLGWIGLGLLQSSALKLLVIGVIPAGSWILLLQRTRPGSVQGKERKKEKQDWDSILALIFLPLEDVDRDDVADVAEHPPASSRTGAFSFAAGTAAAGHHQRETRLKMNGDNPGTNR